MKPNTEQYFSTSFSKPRLARLPMTPYPHLLSPLRIGAITIPNRMVMGAMHTRLETLDRPDERMAAFYAARAAGEIGLILTGGFSPVPEGVMEEGSPLLNSRDQLDLHKRITSEVHKAGGQVILQILHAGRYARVPTCVAPSEGRARINAFAPRVLSTQEVWDTIASFAETAALAQEAGYEGVEIMGSEGYLLNEFTASATNRREDEFGGSFERRLRMPLEVVKAVRERVGPGFVIIYRISSIDLVAGGMTGAEVAQAARQVQAAGADMLNIGVGWHEAVVPTIAASVPRAAWSAAVKNVKQAVTIPVMASNRINTPEVAEDIIASGVADLVSMARPLLADPEFARKTRLGRAEEINTCIACNQACLDRIFTERTATCLVNPRAGREVEFSDAPAASSKRLAVVGAGPAGMAFAINAAQRGHQVTLFEAASEVGGQLNMAKVVPGKNEFHEMLRYFRVMLERTGVRQNLGMRASAEMLAGGGFDEVVLATGVLPRTPVMPGIDHPKVLGYIDVLSGRAQVGQTVAIIGAGGIGFDVAEYLLGEHAESTDPAAFLRYWGVDPAINTPGGLVPEAKPAVARKVHMFQRKPESLGRNLGRTTGWILKARLRKAQVVMTAGATYERIDDEGLHYTVDGQPQVLAVDNVILCAGQVSNRGLLEDLAARGVNAHLIGGADVASELDALRAIDQATRLAVAI